MEKTTTMIRNSVAKLEKAHGNLDREIELHEGAVSLKFSDGSSYTVSIKRNFTKAVLDNRL